MKVYDGTNAVLGRMATRVAKELLKGEQVSIVNCQDILITGNKKNIQEKYLQSRSRVGSALKGPKPSRSTHLIVKRAIRGMLPNYRMGRGRDAWKKLRCYCGIPKELESVEKVTFENQKLKKATKIGNY